MRAREKPILVTQEDFFQDMCRLDGTVNSAHGGAALLSLLAAKGGVAHLELFGRGQSNQRAKFLFLVVDGDPVLSSKTGLPLIQGGQNGHTTRQLVRAGLVHKTGTMRSGEYRVTETGNEALHKYGPWPDVQEILLKDYEEALPDLAKEYRHMFEGATTCCFPYVF